MTNGKLDRGITRGANSITAIFWTLLGIAGMAAGASGYGGAWTFIVGLGATLYGLYGFYRYVFFEARP